jgi:NAD(P)-dependent dehydrogenase (short-subunit alcohol dehydrogenase family)
MSRAVSKQRVLVTGASAGIGRDTARRLAEQGWEVFAAARRTDRLEELRSASIVRATEEILALTDGYGVDAIVNNAGICMVSPLADVTDADLRSQFETNVFGLFAITRALLPQMIARRSGRIVNVSSTGGQISLPLVGVYHATKFALEALSDALRWELSPFGVRVSVIAPGPIRTEFGDKLMSSVAELPADSLYQPLLRHADRIKVLAERWVLRPTSTVTRDIVHALSSRCPRARYVEPRFVNWLIKVYELSPTWLSDWVITRMTGLTPKLLAT